MTRKLLSVPAVLLRRDTAGDAEPLVPRHGNAVPHWRAVEAPGPLRARGPVPVRGAVRADTPVALARGSPGRPGTLLACSQVTSWEVFDSLPVRASLGGWCRKSCGCCSSRWCRRRRRGLRVAAGVGTVTGRCRRRSRSSRHRAARGSSCRPPRPCSRERQLTAGSPSGPGTGAEMSFGETDPVPPPAPIDGESEDVGPGVVARDVEVERLLIAPSGVQRRHDDAGLVEDGLHDP